MRLTFCIAAACVWLAAWPAASAAPSCTDIGSADGANLVVDPTDADAVAGLQISLLLALSPGSFPADEIANKPDACRRGEFTADDKRFEVFGDDEDTPPRWAIGPDRKRIAYVAVAPDPLEALAWAKKRSAGDNSLKLVKPPVYVLAVTDGDLRQIYWLRPSIPSDYRLALDMRAALEGRWSPLATFDPESGQTKLGDLAPAANRNPLAGAAPSEDLQFRAPDGVYFIEEAEGAARHRPSGLVCPKTHGPYRRAELAVFDPAEGGRDVFCRYFEPESWTSVFATKIPDMSLNEVFENYRDEAQAASPVDVPLAPPGAIRTRLPMQATFWKGKEGSHQALWVFKKGDWYLEIRTTYAAGAEARVAQLAQAIVDLQ